MENQEPIHELFERYLADQCTPDQVRELLAYFNLSEDQDGLKALIQAHFEGPGEVSASHQDALQEVHQQLLKKIEVDRIADSQPSFFSLSQRWLRVAAVWVLFALSGGASVYFLSRGWSSGPDQMVAQSSDQLQTEQTGIGERKKVVLEDGSIVWLNAKSKLVFPIAFTKERREVRLEGEAYFEIFRDEQRPFIISSGAIETKVLGTSFNIKAYATDELVAVTVASGKVEVNAPKSSVQIVANQEASYSGGQLHKALQVDAQSRIGWHTGKMQFRNLPLSEVIKILERNYPVHIAYPNDVKDCSVHADFDADTPVESVMEMLAVSLRGKLTRQSEGRYYLDGNCKRAPAHKSQQQ